MQMQLGTIDWLIMGVYFVFVLGVGFALRALHDDEHGFLPIGPFDSGLGRRTCVPLRQSRRAGSHRHGGLGRQVRHRDQSFLLGGRDPGDGVPRRLHDAVLLRLARTLGAGVSEVAFRREDPRLQRHLLCGDDRGLIGHLDVRDGTAAESAARMGLHGQRLGLGRDRADLHPPWRA